MSDHAILQALHVQIDKRIIVLEQTCFDPSASEDATIRARIRRLQLIDVRKFLLSQTNEL